MMNVLGSILLAAAAPSAERVELPIRMTGAPNGARRVSVTITVNGQPIEAGLDTGSVGLRILAPAVPLKGGGEKVRIGFNSGVELDGQAVPAQVGYGTLSPSTVRVQRIDQVGCRKEAPQCDAAGGDLSSFRIMSDGAAGQGFQAILGIGLRDERLGHPLVQAGVGRWIVDLPRTTGETGRLVLNPTDAEVARYRRVRLLEGRNEVAGCIVAGTTRVCAPAMIDSGAPGIQIFGGVDADLLPQGTAASLVLGDGDAAASMPITIGRRDQAAMMRLRPARPDARKSLSFGIAPYLRWSVLYDAASRTLGVADR